MRLNNLVFPLTEGEHGTPTLRTHLKAHYVDVHGNHVTNANIRCCGLVESTKLQITHKLNQTFFLVTGAMESKLRQWRSHPP